MIKYILLLLEYRHIDIEAEEGTEKTGNSSFSFLSSRSSDSDSWLETESSGAERWNTRNMGEFEGRNWEHKGKVKRRGKR